jgi:hypothetical protein
MMTQTVALFTDAYRELNAKKLFWITMLLSGLVVAAYAAVGIDEEGVTFLWFRLGFIPITSELVTPAMLYKQLFLTLGIGIWLTWVAVILALISTAGIVPEMVAGGSIEMLLSKPISRTRLFLTKYLTGLLFATLQVGVFTVASFLVIGVRGGTWEPSLFLAVPVVVCFFSYLFAVCALLGVLTRSTIAALLLTLLFWFALFVVNTADNALLGFRTRFETERDSYVASIDRSREAAGRILTARRAESDDPAPEGYVPTDEEMREVLPWMDRAFTRRDEAEGSLRKLEPWHRAVIVAKTALPKTQETVALLERWLVPMADLKAMARIGQDPDQTPATLQESDGRVELDDEEVQLRVQEKIRERSLWWVLGTSLGFEGLVLAMASLVFVRRDF